MSVIHSLAESGPEQKPTLRPRVHLTGGIVVGIEQISVLRVDRRIVGQSLFEDEGLKKPAGMREMPFRRTHFGHSLDDAILRLKRFAKAFAQLANATIDRVQVIRR